MSIRFRKNLVGILKMWLPLATSITLIFLLIYTVVQQNYRMSANDPQIQITEDVTTELSKGLNPSFFVPTRKIDIAKSLSLYIMIFDKTGKIIASSASLDGKDPILPQGVFDNTKQRGEERFTWQPKTGVRSAAIIKYYKSSSSSGFVLVARSIKEIEQRENNLELMVFITWIITIVVSFSSVYILQKLK